MIRLCHYVTCSALILISLPSALASAVVSDLQKIEHQIQLTRDQLSQAAAELRDAKLTATEKMMEYEAVKEQHERDATSVSANSLDHAQQRLALAEMGVESKTSRFERIQKKLSELADAKQEILAEPPTPEQTTLTLAENQQNPPAAPSENSNIASPAPSSTATVEPDATAQLAPLPLVKKILKSDSGNEPVLTHHGKLSDIYQLNTELQRLERHLLEQTAVSDTPVQAKVFGTAITGEVPLVEMGGNQFFARFPAPAGEASLIIGARHANGYARTVMHVTFLPEEAGKEFFLIFDFNNRDQPRALVFQESLVFTREMFAIHSDF
mgnify:CR=1 FL=1|jgi:Predicted membrane protein